MSKGGLPTNTMRVAAMGFFSAGLQTVRHLSNEKDLQVGLDMRDRLQTPFGVVSSGPPLGHQKDQLAN